MPPTIKAPVGPSAILADLNALGVPRLSEDGSALMRPDGSVFAQLTAPPTFDPPAGAYGPDQNVTLASTTDGALIYYTDDGTDPDSGSTQFTVPIAVTADTELRALAIRPGLLDSAVSSAQYVINGQVATPTFDPPAGEVAADTPVTLDCLTAGVSMFYTLDGTAPTRASTPYTVPIVVDIAKTIKVLAVKLDFTDSGVGSAAYTIAP